MNRDFIKKNRVVLVIIGLVLIIVGAVTIYQSTATIDKRTNEDYNRQYVQASGERVSAVDYQDNCYEIGYAKGIDDCIDEWDNLSVSELIARNEQYLNIINDEDRPSQSKPLLEPPYKDWDTRGSYTENSRSYAIANYKGDDYIWGDEYVSSCNRSGSMTPNECVDEWNTEDSDTLALYYMTYEAINSII